MTSTVEKGNTAEELAYRYLEAQGLRLLERNYRCRSGELDLIMRDDSHLVFVEVRYRRANRYGTPAETVTTLKQRRLVRAASHYLQRRRYNGPCRFDIISITQVHGKHQLEWIKNAFQAI